MKAENNLRCVLFEFARITMETKVQVERCYIHGLVSHHLHLFMLVMFPGDDGLIQDNAPLIMSAWHKLVLGNICLIYRFSSDPYTHQI